MVWVINSLVLKVNLVFVFTNKVKFGFLNAVINSYSKVLLLNTLKFLGVGITISMNVLSPRVT